jgi:FtsH-binding integral membrane protein
MSDNFQNRYAARWGTQATPVAVDEGLRAYMLRVYNYMASGVLLSGIVAFLVANSPAMTQAIFGTPLKWVVMLAPLAFVFGLSAGIHRLSVGAAQAIYWLFAAVMGASLASILLVFTGESVARVFFISAAMFAGTSLYGYTTKADLSKFGSFLMMGLIGIIIAGLVNIFVGSTALQFAISVIGVLVFTGLTAFDTQRIKETYYEGHDRESLSKMALMGALSLYLDFINLFMMLVQLMGDRRSN